MSDCELGGLGGPEPDAEVFKPVLGRGRGRGRGLGRGRGRGNSPSPGQGTEEGTTTRQIPSLNIIPYVEIDQPGKKTAVKILQELGDEYGISREYKYDIVPPEVDGDASSFKVTVSAGLRQGVGYGGTRMEAMCEAAEECLKSLKKYNEKFEFDLDVKKYTKTDPNKDILHVLARTCKEFGLMSPVFESKEKDDGFVYFYRVGKFVSAEGFAPKRRVAQRIAAHNMYQQIKQLYNSGKIDEQ